MIVGSYTIKNLIQNEEFLLELTKNLRSELDILEQANKEVNHEQKEAQKQGLMVKKMTNYMSEEIDRLELENSKKSGEKISDKLAKLSETEKKLKILRTRLSEFVDGEDEDSLQHANSSIAKELNEYDSFLLNLTQITTEKISDLEKIISRIQAEKKEFQQQKILLKEMADLFNEEIEDLEQFFSQIKT